jgi:hypothetical protein
LNYLPRFLRRILRLFRSAPAIRPDAAIRPDSKTQLRLEVLCLLSAIAEAERQTPAA